MSDDEWKDDPSGSGNQYRPIDGGIEGRNVRTGKGWTGKEGDTPGGEWETHDLPRDYDSDDDEGDDSGD